MNDAMTTVGVRVPSPLRKRLDQEADKRGVTRSQCLRQLAEEAVNDEKYRLLLEEVRELKQLVQLLDRRWKIALVAILADAGKASVEDAEAFVRDLP
jgi:predicted DNA-binding protein